MEDLPGIPNDALPNRARNGRGAVGNPAGRFERYTAQAEDDGWQYPQAQSAPLPSREGLGEGAEDNEPPKLQTTLHIDATRTVINDTSSPDIDMRTINPYRGCEHGCIYCFARPSHSYLGFSAGLDFESQILHKPNAPEILLKELAAKNYRVRPITLGSNTDCYQPVERGLKLTRRIVEVLAVHNHPLNIITKSALVVRDIDLLAPMAAKGLAHVSVSLTTLDPALARVMEPRAATPPKRLATMRTLAEAGIPVTVMTAPLIPALTDMEMEKLLEAAYEAGAREAHYTLVRLPWEIKDLFKEWLETHRPERAAHVLSLIRDMRGGKLYDATPGLRRRGTGAYADLLAVRFRLACKRLGLNEIDTELRCDLFTPPDRDGQIGFQFG